MNFKNFELEDIVCESNDVRIAAAEAEYDLGGGKVLHVYCI